MRFKLIHSEVTPLDGVDDTYFQCCDLSSKMFYQNELLLFLDR
jgi:hypothetical protein